ncbi:hypothetical protein BD626DRAFT_576192 [Schizophyllum amplum]|uniref:Uncharacterized protein n=1 Tax=Schizophyllum amplum TaxID=97359 RepID=A0A550BTZ2_9AGAR|nr:hypothetical protein BD626DRAFT_576192 [Auriculariopsis ampla]
MTSAVRAMLPFNVDPRLYPAPEGNLIKTLHLRNSPRTCIQVLDRWFSNRNWDDPRPRDSPLDRKNVQPGQLLCQVNRVEIQCTEADPYGRYDNSYKLLLTLTPSYNDRGPSSSTPPITLELTEFTGPAASRPLWTTWPTSTHVFLESRLVVAVYLLGVMTRGLTVDVEDVDSDARWNAICWLHWSRSLCPPPDTQELDALRLALRQSRSTSVENGLAVSGESPPP